MDWKTSVEARLSQLHSDIRLGATALSGVLVIIIGLYVWVGFKADGISEKISSLSERAVFIETKSQNHENSLSSANQKLDKMDEKINTLLLATEKRASSVTSVGE